MIEPWATMRPDSSPSEPAFQKPKSTASSVART
jgi:hypothetical protein